MIRAFSIKRILCPYFANSEVIHFRYLQATTGLLVSGSTALQFFDRSSYEDSDLDIYVQHDFRIEIAQWLLSIGYVFVPRAACKGQSLEEALDTIYPCDHEGVSPSSPFFDSKSQGYFGRGVANVYNFFKYNPERKIQLITSHHTPLEIILNFHSSKFLLSNRNVILNKFCSVCDESNITRQGLLSVSEGYIGRTSITCILNRRI